MKFRSTATAIVDIGKTVALCLIFLKLMQCITGCEWPGRTVTSGSMEPAINRGDYVFLRNGMDPIQIGEIVVFKVDGKDTPIVHRVIEVHERSTGQVILTKGDNNTKDDRYKIYPPGQRWLQRHHIIGRVVGYLPSVGWFGLIATETPVIKDWVIGLRDILVKT